MTRTSKFDLPEHMSKEELRQIDRSNQRFVGFFVIVIALALFVVFQLVTHGQLYERLDDAGYISHRAERRVIISGSWMVGEIRECATVEGDTKMMDCGDYQPQMHTLPILFHGRIDRTDAGREAFKWRCQRHSESLECWAVN